MCMCSYLYLLLLCVQTMKNIDLGICVFCIFAHTMSGKSFHPSFFFLFCCSTTWNNNVYVLKKMAVVQLYLHLSILHVHNIFISGWNHFKFSLFFTNTNHTNHHTNHIMNLITSWVECVVQSLITTYAHNATRLNSGYLFFFSLWSLYVLLCLRGFL